MNEKFIKIILICVASIFIASCVTSSYKQLPSANYSFRVKSLVMHFTAIDYGKSVEALVDEGFVSSHYLVPESNDPSYPYDDLEILQLVDEKERAWHAGRSYWQGRTALNDSSIGIEIVNIPTCYDDITALEEAGMAGRTEHGPNRLCIFPDFDPKQIDLVIQLSQEILARNPDISPTAVVGHSDIAPSRKNDPGPRFPWFQLYEAGVGAWYDEDTIAQYWQRFNRAMPNVGLVQSALRAYGYGVVETGIIDQQTVDNLSAFQMHFLPWQVTGNLDSRTAAAIFALLDKYFPDALDSLITRYELESTEQAKLALQAKNNQEQLMQGQISTIFPLLRSKTRAYVNNRMTFRAYKNSGQITIESLGAQSADIFVNEQKLNITQPFKLGTRYQYSLSKRTHDGINSLRVDNILPEGSELKIEIPYPSLSLDTSTQAHSAIDFSAVDELIKEDIKNGFPGAVLLVVHEGKVIKHSAYGFAKQYDDGGTKLAQALPMRPDTRFDLASNTKVFATTLAIMKLVSEGKIELEKSVSAYLPEYTGAGREGRSVADLLAHASGYNSEVRFFDAESSLGPNFHSLKPSLTKDLLLTRVPFVAGSGDYQQYSDTNFMILGLLVERISDMPLDEYVENHIYQPLELDSLQFNPLQKGNTPEAFAATEIRGNTRGGHIEFEGVRDYVLQGEVHDEKAFYSMHGVAGHAGLFGDAQDLAVLAQLLLNQGGYAQTRLFDSATLSRFISPRYAQASLGLGWRLAADDSLTWHFGPYASKRAFGHTGWTGTATVIDPDYDLAIILLTNKKHSPVQKQDDIITFAGDKYDTGRYGSVMSAVYEAVLTGVK
jgi:N-acetylmuramoyl-L-alanine amidase